VTLGLLAKFAPLLELYIELNPGLNLLILTAKLLTAALSELTNFITFVENQTKPVGDFFDKIIDFINSITSLSLPSGGADFDLGANISSGFDDVSDFFGFQTGGIVKPNSSGSGFGGGTPVIAAENGGNELLLNSGNEGEALLSEFASKVAEAGGSGGGVINLTLELDGRVLAESSVNYINNGQVKLEVS
jgi:hypothetical protein